MESNLGRSLCHDLAQRWHVARCSKQCPPAHARGYSRDSGHRLASNAEIIFDNARVPAAAEDR